MTILTPMQSKAARQALSLSQSKVARETGINRSTLALFEVNKYLMDDRAMRALRDFYESHGNAFEEAANPAAAAPAAPLAPAPTTAQEAREAPANVPVMDGFAILSGFDQDEVETALDELHANDAVIAEITAQPVKRHWLSNEIDPEPTSKALALMARNYELIRQLQGRVLVGPANDDAEPQTYGEVLRHQFNS